VEECSDGLGLQQLQYDANTDSSAFATLPWAQFCTTDQCGITPKTIDLGCMNPQTLDETQIPKEHAVQLICPPGTLIDAIYAHWDAFGVHSIDTVTCKSVLLPSLSALQMCELATCHLPA
jgi:hypothetical protein